MTVRIPTSPPGSGRTPAPPPIHRAEAADPLPPDRAFRYGWRDVCYQRPDGSWATEQVPLTFEDVLHPQMGDRMIQNDYHQRLCVYLYNVIKARLAAVPNSLVTQDMLIYWDSDSIRQHAPDIAVFFGVPPASGIRENFTVANEGGVRPLVVIEVTSPSTRKADLDDKFLHYQQLAIPYYLLVDCYRRQGQYTTTLQGYAHTEAGYVQLEPDERGWLWVEPLGLWFVLDDIWLACYDDKGRLMDNYTEVVMERDEAEMERDEAENRASAEAIRATEARAEARAAKARAELAEARAELAETETRAAKAEAAEARAEARAAKAEAAEARAEARAAKAEAAEARAEARAAKAEAGAFQARAELAEARAELAETRLALAETETRAAKAETGAFQARAELAEARAELAETRLALAETETRAAKAETAEARAALAHMQAHSESRLQALEEAMRRLHGASEE